MLSESIGKNHGEFLFVTGVVAISNSILCQLFPTHRFYTLTYIFGGACTAYGFYLITKRSRLKEKKPKSGDSNKKSVSFTKERESLCVYPSRKLSNTNILFRDDVQSVLSSLIPSKDDYESICDCMEKAFRQGLSGESNKTASVKMFPTYVRRIPSGREVGEFLALDLGGTNFRVLKVTIKDSKINMKNCIYSLSDSLISGAGEKLFDYIAECLSDFIDKNQLNNASIPLGFTFSFPIEQKALDSGILKSWTKGFSCSDVVGKDIIQLLRNSLKKKTNIGELKPIALLNDTVGTLMSCAYDHESCFVGMILGTGCNTCYIEDLHNVKTWKEKVDEPYQVIINTEWGAFGENGELEHIRSEFDKIIDDESINPTKQIFEKMISGMYLGELTRLVLVRLYALGLIFKESHPGRILDKKSFYSKYLSEIESDNTDDYFYTRQVLEELEVYVVCQDDCILVHYICSLISTRAAFLAATGLSAILKRIQKNYVTVGIDGSLYKYHPRFHFLMKKQIQLLAPEVECHLVLSNDGSGKGAALTAATSKTPQNDKVFYF